MSNTNTSVDQSSSIEVALKDLLDKVFISLMGFNIFFLDPNLLWKIH